MDYVAGKFRWLVAEVTRFFGVVLVEYCVEASPQIGIVSDSKSYFFLHRGEASRGRFSKKDSQPRCWLGDCIYFGKEIWGGIKEFPIKVSEFEVFPKLSGRFY